MSGSFKTSSRESTPAAATTKLKDEFIRNLDFDSFCEAFELISDRIYGKRDGLKLMRIVLVLLGA